MASSPQETAADILSDVVKQVVGSAQRLDVNRIQFAKDIYWARYAINWSMTKYKSFTGRKGFIETELKMGKQTVYRYKLIGKLIHQFKYSDKECQDMLLGIGWSRFCHGLICQKRRLNSKNFILKYKNAPWTNYTRNNPDADGDEVFVFSLPKDYACRLTAVLEEFGMRFVSKKRFNVRDAVMKMIDEKL